MGGFGDIPLHKNTPNNGATAVASSDDAIDNSDLISLVEETFEKLDGLQFDCLKLSPGASADCFGTASCIRIIPNALKSALLTVQFAPSS